MNRLRLEGELVRDSLLAVSGRLNRNDGRPECFPAADPEDRQARAEDGKRAPILADHVRRSVYIFARRNLRFPFLEPFDVPDSNRAVRRANAAPPRRKR